MPSLEDRISAWANRPVDVEPVTGAEVRRRSDGRRSTARHSRWPTRRLVAAAAVVAIAVTAVGALLLAGGGGHDATEIVDQPAGDLSILDAVPLDVGAVQLADYRKARALAGVQPPETSAPDEAVDGYAASLGAVGADPRQAVTYSDPVPVAAWRRELGVDPGRFERAVTFGAPPHQTAIIQGRFDADAIDDAVRSDATWADVLETASHRGVEYYAWPEGVDAERVTPLRPVGWGGYLATSDGLLVLARTEASLHQVVDAISDERPAFGDSSLVRTAVALLPPERTISFVGPPTPAGVVATGPSPATIGDRMTLVAAVPDGISDDDAELRVRRRLDAAGVEVATVDVDDGVASATIVFDDRRGALGPAQDALADALDVP